MTSAGGPHIPGEWVRRAACAGTPSFLDGEDPLSVANARRVCARCVVAAECYDFGTSTGSWGIWGGARLRDGRALRTAGAGGAARQHRAGGAAR